MYAVQCLFLCQYNSYTMWCAKLILVSYFGLIHCRPQDPQPIELNDAKPYSSIETQPQLIKQVIFPDADQGLRPNVGATFHKKFETSTKEILEKIAEVNKNQGLVYKKPKPNYFHFPFSYSRAQDIGDKYTNFKFSENPFTNPVMDYLGNGQNSNVNEDKPNIPSFRQSSIGGSDYQNHNIINIVDQNAKIEPQDHIPGQYIKRKITHYQGFLMPNPYMLNMYNAAPFNMPLSSVQVPDQTFMPTPYSYNNLYQFPSQQSEMHPISTLEASENISQLEHNRSGPKNGAVENKNTNQKNLDITLQTVPYIVPKMAHSSIVPQDSKGIRTNYLYTKNIPPIRNPSNARQNWNWPGANMFPIYIRDPFLQMYYAVTNMIEYGPNSGAEGPCKLTPRPQGTKIKVKPKTTLNINDNGHQVNLNINKKTGMDNIKVIDLKDSRLTDNVQYLDVEDIDIGGDDLVKFSINLPEENFSGGRELKDDTQFENKRFDKLNQLHNNSALFQLASGKLDFQSTSINKASTLVNEQLTSIKEPVLHIEEIEEDPLELEKTDDINVSNQGNKKVFSRENTGNGIFIHKLKVRKGGVAIAGPGGIATAGSGGTAIVGPNGIAYTHPNGLAIAGSGTKVVAVDPDVDLNEVIKDSVMNGTRHEPNIRVGKVVAVGPVIYYNRG